MGASSHRSNRLATTRFTSRAPCDHARFLTRNSKEGPSFRQAARGDRYPELVRIQSLGLGTVSWGRNAYNRRLLRPSRALPIVYTTTARHVVVRIRVGTQAADSPRVHVLSTFERSLGAPSNAPPRDLSTSSLVPIHRTDEVRREHCTFLQNTPMDQADHLPLLRRARRYDATSARAACSETRSAPADTYVKGSDRS